LETPGGNAVKALSGYIKIFLAACAGFYAGELFFCNGFFLPAEDNRIFYLILGVHE
jgi:hypothetical protein